MAVKRPSLADATNQGSTAAITGQVDQKPQPDLYSFIQLGHEIATRDQRGMEVYSDQRMTTGLAICRDGDMVASIELRGSWFDVTAGSRVYRVPLTNVRSARR